jgi:hypothetical protein
MAQLHNNPLLLQKPKLTTVNTPTTDYYPGAVQTNSHLTVSSRQIYFWLFPLKAISKTRSYHENSTKILELSACPSQIQILDFNTLGKVQEPTHISLQIFSSILFFKYCLFPRVKNKR